MWNCGSGFEAVLPIIGAFEDLKNCTLVHSPLGKVYKCTNIWPAIDRGGSLEVCEFACPYIECKLANYL
jgi:hypothetical protein